MFTDRELGAQAASAASAAFHSSVIVALHPPSLPALNCLFLSFSASSIPEIVTAALSNRLKPSMGRIRCFALRWSCSTRLFKCWLDRILTRHGGSPSSFSSRTARCEAASASTIRRRAKRSAATALRIREGSAAPTAGLLYGSPRSPIRHHDHQIPQAQFEARVPAHAQNDDLSVEVPSFKHVFDRDESSHLFIIAHTLAFAADDVFEDILITNRSAETSGRTGV